MTSKMQALQKTKVKRWCRIRRCRNSMDHQPLITKIRHRSRAGQESVKGKQREKQSSFHSRFRLELWRSKLLDHLCGWLRSVVPWAPTVARLTPMRLTSWPRARRSRLKNLAGASTPALDIWTQWCQPIPTLRSPTPSWIASSTR